MKKLLFEYAKIKAKISGSAPLFFSTWVVQSLYFMKPIFKPFTKSCGCIAWLVSNLVRNPDDRFSRDAAQK